MIPTLRKARKSTSVTLGWISALCLSVNIAIAADQDLGRNVEELKPSLQQAIASVNVVQLLSRNHYRKLPIDQENGEKVFQRYLDRLDPNRSFFLQSDIKEFDGYREKLDSSLKNGDLKPAFAMFNRYRTRAEERARFMLALVEQGLGKLDLKRDESLVVDRKEEPWLTSKKEQRNLWRKQFKDSVLSLKLNNKTDEEISEQLTRRNNNLIRRLHQSKSEDAFQTYINSFTGIFDPHTQYFSPQTAENFDINMSLSLEGIGAVLSSEDEYTKVVSVVPGGPAETAGQLKPGDKIVSVAQGRKGTMEDVVGMRLDDVVKLIRGKKQTLVRLEVIPGSSKSNTTRIYEIVRDKVKLEEQDASSRILEVKEGKKTKRIGVIEIPTFYIDFKAAQRGDPDYKSTTRDVRKILNDLKNKNLDGLIVDLRGNGGGSLQEANELTGLFIDQGPTVLVRDSRGRTERQQDPDPSQVYGGPMAVVVDRLSASASEIFAGAMQDYGRAIVIGGQTYGKGTVQSIQPLNHGQLKLTLAKFYRISGQSTQNQGVLPDITYPSLYDGRDIGESKLPDALPWDTISPISFRSYGDFKPYLKPLEQAHIKRTKDNADFVYLNEMKNYLSRYENTEKVSLNENKRKLELQTMRSQRLAIENRLRKSKGQNLLNNLDELEDAEQKETAANHGKKKSKDKDDDAFILEAGKILADLITLEKQQTASR
ncbi:tail-specific protease [Endozoicomonas sp. OPT23]|uniref:carboxy terminal-processing peptidase n=1 Tax=Endozoicomonas sp. OPT23 TaxID=2072845 RepID=UPI00129A8B0E|nr:carboxy terminal-processing peptidase [Endozoicomonas sp. OPT23]MRI34616.1 tail-specific protease [Endozoicomonas sp. OPT23]